MSILAQLLVDALFSAMAHSIFIAMYRVHQGDGTTGPGGWKVGASFGKHGEPAKKMQSAPTGFAKMPLDGPRRVLHYLHPARVTSQLCRRIDGAVDKRADNVALSRLLVRGLVVLQLKVEYTELFKKGSVLHDRVRKPPHSRKVA